MNKRTYLYLFIFCSITFLLDRGIGLLLEKKMDNISYGLYGDINASINTKSDILILGSSRAKHHYIPSILSDSLNATTYNAGLGGYGLFYNYALLNTVIKKSNPKIVILDISPNVIVDPESYSKLNTLFPYINKDTSFLNIVKLNPEYSKLNHISKLYQYNSTLYDIVRSINYENNSDGYTPLSGIIDTTNFSSFHFISNNIDANKVSHFKQIIDICKKEYIKLFVVVSPTYKKFDKKNQIINTFKMICEIENISFHDYSDRIEFYGNETYFKDQLHLNSNGAEYFSQILSKEIRPIIIKNTQNE